MDDSYVPPELVSKLTAGELHALVTGIITASPDPRVGEVWNGPRSTEVALTTTDGRHIVLNLREGI